MIVASTLPNAASRLAISFTFFCKSCNCRGNRVKVALIVFLWLYRVIVIFQL